MLTELSSEKFEWFDPSPIEPFNSGSDVPDRAARYVADPGDGDPDSESLDTLMDEFILEHTDCYSFDPAPTGPYAEILATLVDELAPERGLVAMFF